MPSNEASSRKLASRSAWRLRSWRNQANKNKHLRVSVLPPGHAWLSQGMTNLWANLFLKELKARVKYRINGNYFSKVYAWTVDKQKTALKYLNIGLDGIIANYPSRVNKAIAQFNENKCEHQKVKLATLDDNPFRKYC